MSFDLLPRIAGGPWGFAALALFLLYLVAVRARAGATLRRSFAVVSVACVLAGIAAAYRDAGGQMSPPARGDLGLAAGVYVFQRAEREASPVIYGASGGVDVKISYVGSPRS